MSPPQEVHDLVKRFEENLEAYKSPQYNETQLRREFIDPFFEALVYELYGLTEEEIRILEGGVESK